MPEGPRGPHARGGEGFAELVGGPFDGRSVASFRGCMAFQIRRGLTFTGRWGVYEEAGGFRALFVREVRAVTAAEAIAEAVR